MFREKKFLLIIGLWILFDLGDAWGWGPQGHRVIGHVAELHLNSATKKIIVDEFNINHLADVANWADKVRENRKRENPWHYTNIREGEWIYVAKRDCPDGRCVTEKIKEFSAVLSNPENSFRKKRDALRYLVHFVGDVHQPLHLGNRKDRGGGKIRLKYLGRKVSLHYLWDGGLLDWKKQSLLKYAERLNDRLKDIEKSAWIHSNVDDWANESRSRALKFAYPLGKKKRLSKTYISRGREILDQRMVQAGVRQAHLFNILLQPEK